MSGNIFSKGSAATSASMMPASSNMSSEGASRANTPLMQQVRTAQPKDSSLNFAATNIQERTSQPSMSSAVMQDPSNQDQGSSRTPVTTPAHMSHDYASMLLTKISIDKTTFSDGSRPVTVAREATVVFDDETGQVSKLNGLTVLRPGTILPAGSDGNFLDRRATQRDIFLTWNHDRSGVEAFIVNSEGHARLLTIFALERYIRLALLKTDKEFEEMVDFINKAPKHLKCYTKTMPNGARIPLAHPHLFSGKKVKKALEQLLGPSVVDSASDNSSTDSDSDIAIVTASTHARQKRAAPKTFGHSDMGGQLKKRCVEHVRSSPVSTGSAGASSSGVASAPSPASAAALHGGDSSGDSGMATLLAEAQEALAHGRDFGWFCVVDMASLASVVAALPRTTCTVKPLRIGNRDCAIVQRDPNALDVHA
eukprot:Colp12_sorted_trinity150504_noHs@36077